MYNTIINPLTNIEVNIQSPLGKNIINTYSGKVIVNGNYINLKKYNKNFNLVKNIENKLDIITIIFNKINNISLDNVQILSGKKDKIYTLITEDLDINYDLQKKLNIIWKLGKTDTLNTFLIQSNKIWNSIFNISMPLYNTIDLNISENTHIMSEISKEIYALIRTIFLIDNLDKDWINILLNLNSINYNLYTKWKNKEFITVKFYFNNNNIV